MFEEKQNLINSWNILNNSQIDNELRKKANIYLYEFKVI
jgi:hypothetical protein